MKKLRNAGFGAVELLLFLVIASSIGGLGYYVFTNVKSSTPASPYSNSSQGVTKTAKPSEKKPKESTASSKKSTSYSFDQLGISMDLQEGWEVTTGHTKNEGVNFYEWTVQKTGADGKIEFTSHGFRGGFEGCSEDASLSPVTIKEVAATQNSNLMFMSWSYKNANEVNDRVGIVRTDGSVFRTKNNNSTPALKNKDVAAGNYFFCLSEPSPDFFLKLNSEPAPGYSRNDRVAVYSASSTDNKYLPLLSTAKSYSDIKSMLASIK